MNDQTVAGFWSYTRQDDQLDDGAVLRLARRISDEYDLLSGEPLELFIDRNDISWGQEWRERIDSSLARTTFFIPIITPRYFARPECRRELLEFAAKAVGLGASELLLPILYVETEGLSPESPDEAMALVARAQYMDWRSVRLKDQGSEVYRQAVSDMARRLIEIARKVAEVQLSRELNTDTESDGTDGIVEMVEQISALLPQWLDAVQSEKLLDAQMTATAAETIRQIDKLKKRKAPASAVLATQTRLAKELLPLVERGVKDAEVYSKRSIDLDPLMSELARQLMQDPKSMSLITPILESVDEAVEAIHESDQKRNIPVYLPLSEYFGKIGHLARVFQKCHSAFSKKDQLAFEGNEVVLRWDAELKQIGLEMPKAELG